MDFQAQIADRDQRIAELERQLEENRARRAVIEHFKADKAIDDGRITDLRKRVSALTDVVVKMRIAHNDVFIAAEDLLVVVSRADEKPGKKRRREAVRAAAERLVDLIGGKLDFPSYVP